MNRDQLIVDLHEAFVGVEPPANTDIAPHPCCECAEVTADLLRYIDGKIPDEYLHRRFDFIPLLSPTAFRYFLPSILEFTLRNTSSDLWEFGLYALCPPTKDSPEMIAWWTKRLAPFTDRERDMVCRYLEYRRSVSDSELELGHIDRAHSAWSRRTAGSA